MWGLGWDSKGQQAGHAHPDPARSVSLDSGPLCSFVSVSRDVVALAGETTEAWNTGLGPVVGHSRWPWGGVQGEHLESHHGFQCPLLSLPALGNLASLSAPVKWPWFWAKIT